MSNEIKKPNQYIYNLTMPRVDKKNCINSAAISKITMPTPSAVNVADKKSVSGKVGESQVNAPQNNYQTTSSSDSKNNSTK